MNKLVKKFLKTYKEYGKEDAMNYLYENVDTITNEQTKAQVKELAIVLLSLQQIMYRYEQGTFTPELAKIIRNYYMGEMYWDVEEILCNVLKIKENDVKEYM